MQSHFVIMLFRRGYCVLLFNSAGQMIYHSTFLPVRRSLLKAVSPRALCLHHDMIFVTSLMLVHVLIIH